MNQKNYYITTPIYYVNDVPHIGHAYTTLACDVLARFKRLDGYNVRFLTGTDEHGQKVEKAAEKAGIAPQAFTDKVSQNFRDLLGVMGFSNDDFIRTTEKRHIAGAQAFWNELVKTGDIYLGKYAGWYAVRDEAFYAESELVNGKAPTGADVEWVEESSYFFKLSAWQDKLLKFYEENPHFIAPESRRNEILSFVRGGLQDLSVSRTSFKWGVPVPNDPAHIMYVWIEALSNYITAIGYPDQAGDYKTFWPCDLHMVGKDIIRFHCVYWPAFLMAAGLKPPKRVFAHGWWTNEGQKISKSVGNVIDPVSLVEKYGLDQVRYFLMREVSFGQDGDFSHAAMIRRTNTELANDYGNLVQRVVSFIHKNAGGVVPQPQDKLEQVDKDMMGASDALVSKIRSMLDQQQLHRFLEAVNNVVVEANKYIDQQAPWTLKKTDTDRMQTVLYVLCEAIRNCSLVMQPFIPDSAAKILDILNVPMDNRSFIYCGEKGRLKSGTILNPAIPVFPRYVEEEAKTGTK